MSDVLVIGPVLLDRYIRCDYTRLDQTAAVPTGRVTDKIERLGGAANVWANLLDLGVQAGFVTLGTLGDDRLWQQQANLLDLTANGRDCRGWCYIGCDAWHPIRKNRLVDTHYRLVARYDEETPASVSAEERERQLRSITAAMEQETPKVVVISDYGKGVFDAGVVAHVKQLAQQMRAIVVVDPYPAHATWYTGADWLTPNAREAQEIYHAANDRDKHDPELCGMRICTSLAVGHTVVTRGEHGLYLTTRDTITHLKHDRHTVVDTTGAGDTVTAVVAWGLSQGLTPDAVAEAANLAGGLVVTKAGTATVSLPGLHRLVCGKHPERKHLTLAEAEQLVARVRSDKRRRVTMVNGAFDLMHDGHRHLLRTAWRAGDLCVAAVNDDASIRRRKGKRRPLQSLAERIEALCAYEYVDVVVAFESDTPAAVIRRLRPQAVFRGESAEPNAEAETIQAVGAAVVTVPTTYHTSTTQIVERVNG